MNDTEPTNVGAYVVTSGLTLVSFFKHFFLDLASLGYITLATIYFNSGNKIMRILLSPAKSLDFKSPPPSSEYSQAPYLIQSAKLIDLLQALSSSELQIMMSISARLAELNRDRFHQWKQARSLASGKQAIFAFQGDVYQGLDANSLSSLGLERAQQRLRVLSGLYGMLSPLDIIMPYRLEMGTKFKSKTIIEQIGDLYTFWQARVTQDLQSQLEKSEAPWLLNLASQEYFKVVDSKALQVPIVSPVFKDYKNGQYKIISFYAKRARGLMTRYCLEANVLTRDQLEAFDLAGYKFDPNTSTSAKPVFLRKGIS